MANYLPVINRSFSALSDPTRRGVLEALTAGEASVSELAAPYGMALPSFLKHLGVLEDAGLITSHKQGRVKYCSIEGLGLDPPLDWLTQRRDAWQTRLVALDHVLGDR